MANTTSYTYLDTRVDQIQARMLSDANRKDSAYQQIDAAKADLDALGPDNAQVGADVDAQAAANPEDAAWQTLKTRKDLLVSEFSGQKTDMTDLQTAMEPWRTA